jgi:hypothetical protein
MSSKNAGASHLRWILVANPTELMMLLQAMSLLLCLLLSTASAFTFSGSGSQTVATRTSTSLPALFGLGAPPAQKAGNTRCDVMVLL